MSQRKGSLYTFGFAAAICVVCSIILAGANTVLKPRQKANIKLDIMVNTLSTVGYTFPELKAKPAQEVFDIYEKEFDALLLDKNNQPGDRSKMETELAGLGYKDEFIKNAHITELLGVFNNKISLLAKRAGQSREEYNPGYKLVQIHKDSNGNPDAYVIHIQGYGLWDLIKGYVALETDLNTVKGISFYDNKETPGLGARITEDWFKEQFKGKKTLDDAGNLVSVSIAKGKAKPNDPHGVDGLSGATLTTKGINNFLKSDLEKFQSYFATLRNQN